MKVGIIGYGSMGKMLLWKFSDSGKFGREDLLAANRTPEKLEEAKDIAVISSNAELAQEADIVFVCVRPQDLRTVLSEISPFIRSGSLVVSLNGSVTFEMMEKVIPGKIAKVIPSVTAEIGRSQTLVCYNGSVEDRDKEQLCSLLSVIGNVIELPEEEIGMGSELVSCMPGFIAAVFDVMCESAKTHTSIPEDQIVKMVLNTMSATGDFMLNKDMAFEDVIARVATPGGITEEGTKVIFDRFPGTADELFDKTLAKRKATADKAAELFGRTE